MYRIAIIVNDNETLHSVYADSERIVRKAMQKVYPRSADNLYTFQVFDKFNIYTLFEKGPNNIFSFDSMFIGTNACNNIEIYNSLTNHSSIIATYIDDGNGNHHGICISNQQKLGGSYQDAEPVAFLPANLSYRLIRRDEKKSSDGVVQIANEADWLVNFPIKITNDIIEKRCSGIDNQFMPHKYRFILEPTDASSYEVVYSDKSYVSADSHFPNERCLLLRSRIGNQRVVISSIILDWAEHIEQLADIIVFITEGINQFAFVDKATPKNRDDVFEQYISKAYDYKIALKHYSGIEAISEVLAGSHQNSIYVQGNSPKKQLYPHVVFVFAASWLEKEIDDLWKEYAETAKNDLVFYRLVSNKEQGKDELIVHSVFSRSIKNSRMFLDAIEWISANFITKKWRKSVWTYEYILNLYSQLEVASTGFIVPLFREIQTHYKIQNELPGGEKDDIDLKKVYQPELFENLIFQSYDNVFNSTCSCCNVIYMLYYLCTKNSIEEIILDNKLNPISSLLDVRNWVGNWIIYKLNNFDFKKIISWQDRLMAIVSLYDSHYIEYVQTNNPPIYEFIQKEIQECNKLLDSFFTQTEKGTIQISTNINSNDMCKLLKYLFASKNYKTKTETVAQIDAIETALRDTQQYNGMWDNLSKTAEIAIALLYRNHFSDNTIMSDTYMQITNKAINCIQSSFDYSTCCWLNDENTTAKSLTAIYEYGLVFSCTFNDFLIGMTDTLKRYGQSSNASNNIKALDYAQQLNNELIHQKYEKDIRIKHSEETAAKNKKIIKTYRFIVAVIASAEALTLLFMGCLLGILASTYNDVLKTIMSNNVAIFLSTSLGLVITTIFTGIAQHIKKKLIEGDPEERD